jgi:hypothetical protein
MLAGVPLVVAVLLFLAAAFGGFVAWSTHWISCLDDSSSMCPEGVPTTTMILQLVVGSAGVAIAGAMLVLTLRGRTRAARWALAAGLTTFAAWAVLNDAAVHGWGRDMRFW